ncbi:hypothetical protein D7X33_34885 [Butyricicoccus sp. 1XD8-22]|nr:hypothetical protein D7X33_34885 [Butyricicoccus sp. 1XD8-22]
MGMYDNLKDINKVLRNDETLLRLLFYPPQDVVNGIKDPLDESLPNILDNDPMELRVLREKRIKVVPKSDDLVDEPICRIYLYAGKRRPVDGYFHANQQIIIDILCEESFEEDLRSSRISDRICELLINKRITGLGKVKYIDGRQISAPSKYVGYSHVFEVGAVDGL